MTTNPSVVIHFKEIEQDEPLRESIEKKGQQLGNSFREVSKIEISLAPNGVGFVANGHVTGKGTDIATQVEASELSPAVDSVFAKFQRKLRKLHDKRIFAQRREAQRDPAKRMKAT
ncbi:MAG TPA: HPF/RaiA family ribosome-associated protein [Myxococcota bacterium]